MTGAGSVRRETEAEGAASAKGKRARRVAERILIMSVEVGV